MSERNPFEKANELTAIQCVEQAGALMRTAGMMLQVVAKNPPAIYGDLIPRLTLATNLIDQADKLKAFADVMREIREVHGS
jgi:hypothetical protein